MDNIRIEPYVPEDKMEVLQVLKEVMPGNIDQEWFDWKHESSPFGRSLAWLAKDDAGIIGCNFFMRYELYCNGEVKMALRSCESAVLPRGRRKGIFSKLVTQAHALVENDSKWALIGTPNANSIHGFQKLGWATESAFNYRISPIIALGFADLITDTAVVCELLGRSRQNAAVTVRKGADYYKWRYSASAGNEYHYAALKNADNPAACIYKIRKVKGVNAIVLLDSIGARRELKILVRSVCMKNNALLIIHLAQENFGQLPFVMGSGAYEYITFAKQKEQHRWSMSLGDLEDVL